PTPSPSRASCSRPRAGSATRACRSRRSRASATRRSRGPGMAATPSHGDDGARPLSAYDIVRLCEWGRDKHALDRAIVLLRAACPAAPPARPPPLPPPPRAPPLPPPPPRPFGSSRDLPAPCPACTEALEFTMRAEDITVPPPGDVLSGTLSLSGFSLDYRLPD